MIKYVQKILSHQRNEAMDMNIRDEQLDAMITKVSLYFSRTGQIDPTILLYNNIEDFIKFKERQNGKKSFDGEADFKRYIALKRRMEKAYVESIKDKVW